MDLLSRYRHLETIRVCWGEGQSEMVHLLRVYSGIYLSRFKTPAILSNKQEDKREERHEKNKEPVDGERKGAGGWKWVSFSGGKYKENPCGSEEAEGSSWRCHDAVTMVTGGGIQTSSSDRRQQEVGKEK
ncbi:hypothetical protein Bbelb_338280 [Branchiostoma belcheri]|nr:hypothetical protein Bbelb_338280 [Branchiostoma belcheri]